MPSNKRLHADGSRAYVPRGAPTDGVPTHFQWPGQMSIARLSVVRKRLGDGVHALRGRARAVGGELTSRLGGADGACFKHCEATMAEKNRGAQQSARARGAVTGLGCLAREGETT